VVPRLAGKLARPAAPGWRIHPEDMDSDARFCAVFRRRDRQEREAKKKPPAR
jgi:hypothetical protein